MVMVVNEGFGVFRVIPDPVTEEKRRNNQKELDDTLEKIQKDKEARKCKNKDI